MQIVPKLLALAVVAATACSVESFTFQLPPVAVGGTITGLDGTGLVLSNHGEQLAITGNGAFRFATPVERGTSYSIEIAHQPESPAQLCTVTNGTGVAGETDVANVQVSCNTNAFGVGGMVTGLAGAGLVLQNNAGDNLAVAADGTFAFATPVASGESYDVRVAMQPALPTQVCTVSNGTGTVGAGAVQNISVSCATSSFTIGGTVTGLSGGGLVLHNNGGDALSIAGDGSFTFAAPIASGATFEVTVTTQPAGPAQTCTVAGGTGTVGGGNVTSVAINCTTNGYMVGGTISGLSGTVRLRNNGGDDLDVTANGTFAFATPVLSGAPYSVTVLANPMSPISQTCVVTNGSGTVVDADITSVVVTCTTNRYNISGTLSGLATGNSITLRNNGGNNLVRSANGGFTFTVQIASGAPYAVTILANPSSPISQTCMVTNGSGIVGGADLTNVQVTCTTNSFTIGGAVSGLAGAGLVLRNATTDLPISGNGPFTFPLPVASGATYAVTVKTQPASQSCTVTNGAGTVGAANVTNVQVVCTSHNWSTSTFPIAIPGASGGFGDLTLDNNGDALVVVPGARSIVRVNHVTGAQSTVATNIGTNVLLGVAYRAANDMIYACNDNELFAVTQSGTVTSLGPFGGLNAIAIAPPSFGAFGGFIIGVGQAGSVIAVNPVGGAVTAFAPAAGQASDLAFAPDGTLYIAGGNTVRTVTADGVVTQFVAGFNSADGITITPDGGRMFIADSVTDTVQQVTIPGAVIAPFAAADIDSGFFVGGILAAPGNTLIVMTGEGALTLLGFTY